jgi:hypothetical protein
MAEVLMDRQEIVSLRDFYDLMDRTRQLRVQIVQDIFDQPQGIAPRPEHFASLQNALASLEAVAPGDSGPYSKIFALDGDRRIEADLKYEITELRKDIIYLEHGERDFLHYLAALHPDFERYVAEGIRRLQGVSFNCFITDRDGTTNNYCGRYRSSIQSVYNAVFLSRFAYARVRHPLMITSAPLDNGGIAEISVNPGKSFIYAASKGREYFDLAGRRGSYPIEPEQQALLDEFNRRITEVVEERDNEKFSLIGSGLQFKFGQTTIARQDIAGSVPAEESAEFLRVVENVMAASDPSGDHFRIVDTGLDIEVVLTVGGGGGLKDFDKADAVRFLDKALDLDMGRGPHLVCGDTASDVPMLEAALEKTPDVRAMFVTDKEDLSRTVTSLCPGALILPEPDMLVTILGSL